MNKTLLDAIAEVETETVLLDRIESIEAQMIIVDELKTKKHEEILLLDIRMFELHRKMEEIYKKLLRIKNC